MGLQVMVMVSFGRNGEWSEHEEDTLGAGAVPFLGHVLVRKMYSLGEHFLIFVLS